MSARTIDIYDGNLEVMKHFGIIEETNKDSFIKHGEYKETELDKHKREVDFLIVGIGNRYEIKFNHKMELKENRSIKASEYCANVYYVTENALNKLKKQYTYECDL